jgi:hypothetical protein
MAEEEEGRRRKEEMVAGYLKEVNYQRDCLTRMERGGSEVEGWVKYLERRMAEKEEGSAAQ